MDVCLVIREPLARLGLEQKDLAAAAEVTESYISQLLTRKKLPPAPDRTDIYEKMGEFLKLASGRLAKLAELQRRAELKKDFEDPPTPLFQEVRELVLRKCMPEKQQEIRAIFEKQPFGELERLVTQKLLDVIKRVAREEWSHDEPRLGEDHRKEDRVDPEVIGAEELDQMTVEMQNEIEGPGEHRRRIAGNARLKRARPFRAPDRAPRADRRPRAPPARRGCGCRRRREGPSASPESNWPRSAAIPAPPRGRAP